MKFDPFCGSASHEQLASGSQVCQVAGHTPGLALGTVPHAGNAQEAGVRVGEPDGEPTEQGLFTACAAVQLEIT